MVGDLGLFGSRAENQIETWLQPQHPVLKNQYPTCLARNIDSKPFEEPKLSSDYLGPECSDSDSRDLQLAIPIHERHCNLPGTLLSLTDGGVHTALFSAPSRISTFIWLRLLCLDSGIKPTRSRLGIMALVLL
jgi:hypothetical protein